MIKNCLFAVALLSLALAGGCAKGGNGAGNGITVTVSDGNLAALYVTQSVQFTAAVTGTTNTAVTWSLSGTACTGTPNPCGTIDPTGLYKAPATAPNPAAVTFTATSQADSTAIGSLGVKVVQVKVVVTPTPVTVGAGLVQQFTAVAVPDSAPQTFTWTCTPTSSCGSLVQDSTTSGLAVYTAPSSTGSVVVSATSKVAQIPVSAGVGTAKVTVAASRLPSGTYAFRFSGYDASNHAVAAAGSLTLAANDTITAGVEDVLSASGPQQFAIISGSYSPSSGNNNSNNLGTLTLNLGGGATNKYTAVLTSSGIIRMIESDSTGRTGSGVMQKSSANTIFNNGAQTFVFGFTGVDLPGNRVGYVGMLPMNGGAITGGLLDSNDNGNTSNVCGAPPCAVTGNYSADPVIPGLWHMTLTSGTTLNFDFFVSAGQTTNATAPNPLTLYAISTDPIDAIHPALSGSMVYQFPMTYNNAAFCSAATSQCTSVSNLTGASANVSLTFATTDGTSNGTGGAGGFTGNFDQNNDGTILSVSSFSYTYVATSGANGRYTFQMLGNPNASPVVAPLPFILYASGANRGFLLDQSSPSVMTGTMDPQPSKSSYAPTELPGTFAAATISDSDPTLAPVVQNLLLTSPGGSAFNVTGAQNPNNQPLTGMYTMTVTGTGSITLTAPPPPSVATNAIYAIGFDVANSVITDFMMIGTTSGTPSSIIFAQE